MLALMVVFVLLFALTLGFWGAIHSAILQSVSARHYAFEILNNRSHFEYHRDWKLDAPSGNGNMLDVGNFAGEDVYHGDNMGMRLFYITGLNRPDYHPTVTTRGLNFFKEIDRDTATLVSKSGTVPGHEKGLSALQHQNIFHQTHGRVNPLWLMTGYGICVNHSCGE